MLHVYLEYTRAEITGSKMIDTNVKDGSASHFSVKSGPQKQTPSKSKVNSKWTQSKPQMDPGLSWGLHSCVRVGLIGSVVVTNLFIFRINSSQIKIGEWYIDIQGDVI